MFQKNYFKFSAYLLFYYNGTGRSVLIAQRKQSGAAVY